MTTISVGVFTINYTLFTNANPGYDIQFGIDFTLTTTGKKPLCQLIYPATNVGTNTINNWNVDNHRPKGNALSLVFGNAENGTISDTPREISARNKGIVTTKFAVYIVDTVQGKVQSQGVRFGYTIDTGSPTPVTTFVDLTSITLPGDQLAVMTVKFNSIKKI